MRNTRTANCDDVTKAIDAVGDDWATNLITSRHHVTSYNPRPLPQLATWGQRGPSSHRMSLIDETDLD